MNGNLASALSTAQATLNTAQTALQAVLSGPKKTAVDQAQTVSRHAVEVEFSTYLLLIYTSMHTEWEAPSFFDVLQDLNSANSALNSAQKGSPWLLVLEANKTLALANTALNGGFNVPCNETFANGSIANCVFNACFNECSGSQCTQYHIQCPPKRFGWVRRCFTCCINIQG